MSLSVFNPEDIRIAYIDKESDSEIASGRPSPEEVYKIQLDRARDRAEKGYCDKDLWDMEAWFLKIMPAMLAEFKSSRNGSPGCLGENYVNSDGILVNDTCHAEWDKILDEMIRLFLESREETCGRSNPFDAEHSAALADFTSKYGMFGERLYGEPDRSGVGVTAHFMGESPAHAEIDAKWHEAERELEAYRTKCRNEALALFGKWLPHLAD